MNKVLQILNLPNDSDSISPLRWKQQERTKVLSLLPKLEGETKSDNIKCEQWYKDMNLGPDLFIIEDTEKWSSYQ